MDAVTQQKTPGSAHAAFTLAALVSAGGLYGFIKSRSVPSAVSGLGLGALFAYAGSLITRGEPLAGYQVACGTSVVTGAAMATRYQKTRKLMPAGILAPLTFVSAGYYAFKASEPR